MQVGEKNIRWDIHRHRTVLTPHSDSLAAQAHEASRHGLGQVRSHELRAWYTLQAEQDNQDAAEMLTYFDSLDADLAALAAMSHSDMLADAEAITPTTTHSGAPPGGERAPRPHHVATVCAGRRNKEAGCHARLHTDTRTITAQ